MSHAPLTTETGLDPESTWGPADTKTLCDVSVIIPILNEADNVEPLYAELLEVMEGTTLDYEILFIDDGSKDRSLERLRKVVASNPRR